MTDAAALTFNGGDRVNFISGLLSLMTVIGLMVVMGGTVFVLLLTRILGWCFRGLLVALSVISWPLRRAWRWWRGLSLLPKICLIAAPIVVWGLGRWKIGRLTLALPRPHLSWGWLAVGAIVAAVVLWLLKRRRQAAPAPTTTTPAGDDSRPSRAGLGRWQKIGWLIFFFLLLSLIYRHFALYDEADQRITPIVHNFFIRHGLSSYGGTVVGDGGAPGTRAVQVVKLGQNHYRFLMPADTDWDPTGVFVSPGEQVDIRVTEPRYQRGGSIESVAGVRWPGRSRTFTYGSDILMTPHDAWRQADRQQYFIRASLPSGGLMVKFGRRGLPRFCGRPVRLKCPGRWQFSPPRRELFFGLNIEQTAEERNRLSGLIVINITVLSAAPTSSR